MTPEEMKCIVPNRYHMLFALLGSSSISIWHSKPCVEILCYKRPEEQVVRKRDFDYIIFIIVFSLFEN